MYSAVQWLVILDTIIFTTFYTTNLADQAGWKIERL